MKILYLDTCVLISYLKKDDIFHAFSKKIMNASNIERIGSSITLIETASVLSRQFLNLKFDKSKIDDWEELNLEERRALITRFLIEKIPISYYTTLGKEKIKINMQDMELHVDFSKAFKISPLFSLRTLDNLQISAALNLRDIKNLKIDYFVTTDREILNLSKVIKDSTNLTIIHSEKLVEIEHL